MTFRFHILILYVFALSVCSSTTFANEPANKEIAPPHEFLAIYQRVREDIELQNKSEGILPKEADTYYWTLSELSKLTKKSLNERSDIFLKERWENSKYESQPFSEFPTYVDQHFNTDQYQGQVITLRGHLQRLIRVEADENEYGVETLYEAWMFPEKSQRKPVVIVCTEIPDDMPVGDKTTENVRVTGVFFKRYNYRGNDYQVKKSYRFAPMILAHRLERLKIAPAPLLTPTTIAFTVIILILLVLAISLGIRFGKANKKNQLANTGMPDELEPFNE